ncbi:MAG: hypothetical protein NWR52_09220, partial [Paracoccaceae bacterium]|nr:hypothetical protein [Paracoccaceae bacterium]
VSYAATAASRDFCQRLFMVIPLCLERPLSGAIEDILANQTGEFLAVEKILASLSINGLKTVQPIEI